MLVLPLAVVAAQDRMDREALLRRAQEVAERIAEGRGLRPTAPIRTEVLSREKLLEHVRRRLHEESPPEELRAEGVLLERLGLLETAEDYEDALYALYEQQVAGLYDPDDRTTYVLDDLFPAEADLTLWHEIVHALQDQLFCIGDRQEALEDDGDRGLAFSAVCEGDAVLTSTALQYDHGWDALDWLVPRDLESLRSLVMPVQFVGPGSSSALLEFLSFPYVEGVAFVREHLDRGGTTAIDALFRRPPESTEQVIHPEKYGGPDAPVTVRFRDGAFPAWHTAYQDTAGEFVVRLWLGSRLSRSVAVSAATGWGGDRMLLLVPQRTVSASCLAGASPLDDRLWACGAAPDCAGAIEPPASSATGWVVWATVWDPAPEEHPQGAAGEAAEFRDAATRALRERLGADPPSGASTGPEAMLGAADGTAEARTRPTAPETTGAADPGTGTADQVMAGPHGVAGVRHDGRWVWLAVGPPGEEERVRGLLEQAREATLPRTADEPAPPGNGSADTHE
ncbi:MAG: hypothetical protein JXB32_17405 [Deltaproteobacteria bacterium]|nr:hypothetical protein [Deltaproteobacteria bacterium]